MGHINVLWQFMCIVLVVSNARCTPFLYNAPRAFFTFLSEASSASSTPNEPYTNIADFTKNPKHEAQEEMLEEDYKQKDKLSELDDFADEGSLPPELTNEANPSFLSKKINKLLSKLTLFAKLSGPIAETPATAENTENLDDVFKNKDLEDDSKNINDTLLGSKNATEVEDMLNTLPALRILYQNNSDDAKLGELGGYKYDKPEQGDRERLELNDDSSSTSKKVIKKAALQEDTSDVNSRSQGIGLFFLELIASAVGLAYGAVAQLQNIGQNRP